MSQTSDSTQSADICLESQILQPDCLLDTILNDSWREFEHEYRHLLRKTTPVTDESQHKGNHDQKDKNGDVER